MGYIYTSYRLVFVVSAIITIKILLKHVYFTTHQNLPNVINIQNCNLPNQQMSSVAKTSKFYRRLRVAKIEV